MKNTSTTRSPRGFRKLAAPAVAVALLSGAVTPAVATPDRPELREAVQGFVDLGFAGMQVRVDDEQGTWTGSAGVRKLGEPAKPPENAMGRVGSNTKTFVATMVLQLVAEGRIGLDAPARDYLPEFALDRRITVRMLLQHTSGVFSHTGDYYNGKELPGLPSTGQAWVDNRFHTYQPAELVRYALAKPLLFAPGTDWNYSNTNYTLAALLVEEVSGRPFAEELRRRITGPLGLTGTVAPGARSVIPGPHSHGYYHYQHNGVAKTVDVTRQNPSLIFGAGDLISTAEDLHTFFAALQGGQLLPAPLLAEMRKPHPKAGYGLGVFVEDAGCGTTVVRHNGSTVGFGALMYSTPDGSRTLTALLTGGDRDIDVVNGYPQALSKLLKAEFCDQAAS